MIVDLVMPNDSFPAASQKHKQKYLYLSSDSPSLWNSSNRASSVAFLHSFRPCCFFALMATRHSLTHKASFPWRFFLAREASIRNSASSLVLLQDKHQPAVRKTGCKKRRTFFLNIWMISEFDRLQDALSGGFLQITIPIWCIDAIKHWKSIWTTLWKCLVFKVKHLGFAWRI